MQLQPVLEEFELGADPQSRRCCLTGTAESASQRVQLGADVGVWLAIFSVLVKLRSIPRGHTGDTYLPCMAFASAREKKASGD